jgi:hypothetical protein
MRRKAAAAEASLEQLQPAARPTTAHPITARLFKTFVSRTA